MIRVSDPRLTLESAPFIEFYGKFTRTGRDVLVHGFVGGARSKAGMGRKFNDDIDT